MLTTWVYKVWDSQSVVWQLSYPWPLSIPLSCSWSWSVSGWRIINEVNVPRGFVNSSAHNQQCTHFSPLPLEIRPSLGLPFLKNNCLQVSTGSRHERVILRPWTLSSWDTSPSKWSGQEVDINTGENCSRVAFGDKSWVDLQASTSTCPRRAQPLAAMWPPGGEVPSSENRGSWVSSLHPASMLLDHLCVNRVIGHKS